MGKKWHAFWPKRKLLKERLDFPINPNMILILSGFSFKNECVLDIAAIPYNLKCRHSLSQERYDCNSGRLPSTAILMKYTQSSFFKKVYFLLIPTTSIGKSSDCSSSKIFQVSWNNIDSHETINSKANQKGQKTARLTHRTQVEKSMSKPCCNKNAK